MRYELKMTKDFVGPFKMPDITINGKEYYGVPVFFNPDINTLSATLEKARPYVPSEHESFCKCKWCIQTENEDEEQPAPDASKLALWVKRLLKDSKKEIEILEKQLRAILKSKEELKSENEELKKKSKAFLNALAVSNENAEYLQLTVDTILKKRREVEAENQSLHKQVESLKEKNEELKKHIERQRETFVREIGKLTSHRISIEKENYL